MWTIQGLFAYCVADSVASGRAGNPFLMVVCLHLSIMAAGTARAIREIATIKDAFCFMIRPPLQYFLDP